MKQSGSYSNRKFTANQIFIGCRWKLERPKYERLIKELNKRFPLYFSIVGRDGNQDAEDLLKLIVDSLFSSSEAIFDATGGNANVSLEYGLAEAWGIKRALYLSTHKSSKRGVGDLPIIQDLAGKRRMPYAQQNDLQKLLENASKTHAYTLIFEKFIQGYTPRAHKGQKKRNRALALKVIHALDGQIRRRRVDLVEALQRDQVEYGQDEIDVMIRALHRARLIRSGQGPYATVEIWRSA